MNYVYKNTSSRDHLDNAYYTGYGRAYGAWIGTRYSGVVEGDAILNPAYMIESLIRDEVNIERFSKITMTKIGSPLTFTIDGLKNNGTNDYVDAYLMLRTNGGSSRHKITASSCSSGTTTLEVDGTLWVDLGYTVGTEADCTGVIDNILTNVPQIDETSFDNVAAEMDTQFIQTYNVAIYDKTPVSSILSNILKDLHLMLYRDFNTYYLTSLYPQTTVSGTLDSPLISNGIPQITVSKTDIELVYTKFSIPYKYLYSIEDSIGVLTIDKNSITPTDVGITPTHLYDYCKDAHDKYKSDREFVLNTSNLSHPESILSALQLMERLIPFYTQRRLLVTYKGDILTHKDYRIGQQVLLDMPEIIPTGINISSNFIIYGRTVVTKPTNKYYEFKLMELPIGEPIVGSGAPYYDGISNYYDGTDTYIN